MQLNLPQLEAHLRQALKPVYLLAGDEPLFLQESADALRAAARTQGFVERQVLDVERGFDWSQLQQAGSNLSLFSSQRLIELRVSGALGDAGSKALKAYAADPPPDTVLLVLLGPLDGRQRKSAWFNALDKVGVTMYFWPIKPDVLEGWIGTRLRSAGLKADAAAVQLLAERTEGNLLAAAQDIEKLKLLHPGGQLDAEAVRTAVADSAHFEAFDLMDKILMGDGAGAARSLRNLRANGVQVPALIGAWAYVLRQWSTAASHYARRKDAKGACAAAHIYGPRQAPYLKALGRARPEQVHSWLARCADIDLQAKSTGGSPAAWEELITCMLAASGVSIARA